MALESYQRPQPGSDIQLNINIDLQIKAEDTLRQQLDATRGGRQVDTKQVLIKKAPAGSAVVTDPNNGEVLALATFPTYNPADFVNGISQEKYAQLSDTNGISALVDRSITGQYAARLHLQAGHRHRRAQQRPHQRQHVLQRHRHLHRRWAGLQEHRPQRLRQPAPRP